MLQRALRRKKLAVILGMLTILVLIWFQLSHEKIGNKENLSRQGLSSAKGRNNSEPRLTYSNLVILIISSPTKSVTRTVLRETWLTYSDSRTRHYFVIGSQALSSTLRKDIQDENSTYGDLLILENIHDSYETLSEKVLASLQWIHLNLDFRFVLKCDDDSFVRIPQLIDELEKQPQKQLYMGFFKGGSTVHRTGKWKEPNWFLCDTYLPYALGGGYILSSDVVEYLSKNSPYLQHYKGEDVSMGLWLSPLKLHRIHDVRFDTEYKSRGCSNSYLVTHKQNAGDMREKHSNLENIGQMCQSETRVKYSYNYNWTVPPSKCCKNFDPALP